MNKKDGEKIAAKYLLELQKSVNHELQIINELTREEEFGWVFFYTSKKYLETKDMQFALVGNAPFIVDAQTGVIEETGTAHPLEYYIELYRLHGTCY